MRFKVLAALSLLTVVAALPGKLLRVPKIYNALITTKEKLLPSEAYPATTGPIFQPIAFTGEPILLNANDFINSANQQEAWRRASQSERDGDDKSGEDSSRGQDREPSPVVFYPRYGVYYPHHTVVSYVNTLQHSFVYTAVDHSKGAAVAKSLPLPPPRREQPTRTSTNVEEYAMETSYPQSEVTYAKNNRPTRVGVPDVPPPPPPVAFLSDDREKKDTR